MIFYEKLEFFKSAIKIDKSKEYRYIKYRISFLYHTFII